MTLGRTVCTRQFLRPWWILASGIGHVDARFMTFTSNERNIRNPISGNQESDVAWKGRPEASIANPSLSALYARCPVGGRVGLGGLCRTGTHLGVKPVSQELSYFFVGDGSGFADRSNATETVVSTSTAKPLTNVG
jgi:hypothetical protein